MAGAVAVSNGETLRSERSLGLRKIWRHHNTQTNPDVKIGRCGKQRQQTKEDGENSEDTKAL